MSAVIYNSFTRRPRLDSCAHQTLFLDLCRSLVWGHSLQKVASSSRVTRIPQTLSFVRKFCIKYISICSDIYWSRWEAGWDAHHAELTGGSGDFYFFGLPFGAQNIFSLAGLPKVNSHWPDSVFQHLMRTCMYGTLYCTWILNTGGHGSGSCEVEELVCGGKVDNDKDYATL